MPQYIAYIRYSEWAVSGLSDGLLLLLLVSSEQCLIHGRDLGTYRYILG